MSDPRLKRHSHTRAVMNEQVPFWGAWGCLKGTTRLRAGTTLDYGCYAPAVVFTEVFKRRGVEILIEGAREPMGRLSCR